jgi:hypothetical protein
MRLWWAASFSVHEARIKRANFMTSFCSLWKASAVYDRTRVSSDEYHVVARPWPGGKKRRGGWAQRIPWNGVARYTPYNAHNCLPPKKLRREIQ